MTVKFETEYWSTEGKQHRTKRYRTKTRPTDLCENCFTEMVKWYASTVEEALEDDQRND